MRKKKKIVVKKTAEKKTIKGKMKHAEKKLQKVKGELIKEEEKITSAKPDVGLAYKVGVENVRALSISGASTKKAMQDFDDMTERLEDFLEVLEKKFRQVIWYIGMDIIDDRLTERFVFAKSGFMEIVLKDKPELKAFFPAKKQAKKFAGALRKISAKYGSIGKITLYE